jgi:hypothetical protein
MDRETTISEVCSSDPSLAKTLEASVDTVVTSVRDEVEDKRDTSDADDSVEEAVQDVVDSFIESNSPEAISAADTTEQVATQAIDYVQYCEEHGLSRSDVRQIVFKTAARVQDI